MELSADGAGPDSRILSRLEYQGQNTFYLLTRNNN
jgi:hypothetical protein